MQVSICFISLDKRILVLYIGRFQQEMQMRIALGVEYDGSQYHGWQGRLAHNTAGIGTGFNESG